MVGEVCVGQQDATSDTIHLQALSTYSGPESSALPFTMAPMGRVNQHYRLKQRRMKIQINLETKIYTKVTVLFINICN